MYKIKILTILKLHRVPSQQIINGPNDGQKSESTSKMRKIKSETGYSAGAQKALMSFEVGRVGLMEL